MIRKLVALSALCLAAGMCFAQMDSSGVERRLERLKTDLSLTADQTARIRTILHESRVEGQKIRAAHPDDMEAGREAMMKQREASDKKILSVLTEEQKARYEKIRAERRQMMRQGPR